MKYTCDKCGKHTNELLVSAYGVQMCEDCWDEYLFTDEGKVEVILGILHDEHSMDEFDADFLGHAAVQWNKFKSQFDYPEEYVEALEAQAREKGLL